MARAVVSRERRSRSGDIAITAAPSLGRGPRRNRRRSSHRVIAPTNPKAVSAMPRRVVPAAPRRKGREARVASTAAAQIHAPLPHDEAAALPGCPLPCGKEVGGAHAGPAPPAPPGACG